MPDSKKVENTNTFKPADVESERISDEAAATKFLCTVLNIPGK